MGSQLLLDELFQKSVRVMQSARTLAQISVAQKFCNRCRDAWLDKHYPQLSGDHAVGSAFRREEASWMWDNALAYMTE